MTRIVAAWLLLATVAHARPPAPNSPDAIIMRDFQEWIRTQNSTSGQYCCDLSDGRPLQDNEVRIAGDRYQVLYSRAHWADGTDQWIDVPPTAVLSQLSPVGYVVAWIVAGHVYCLALVGAM